MSNQTVYVGNLAEEVTEELLWELMIQAGPVVSIHMPKDRVTMLHQGFGFVEYLGEEDANYACGILNMIKLYGKPIRVNKASSNAKSLDVGANLFIGNLDPEVDENMLYETFSAFGNIITTPKIGRDLETGAPKGFGFVSYDSFEASDAAIMGMNNQFFCNKTITVSYAFKKDGKGERHGSATERLLAAQSKNSQAASGGPAPPAMMPPAPSMQVIPGGPAPYTPFYPPAQRPNFYGGPPPPQAMYGGGMRGGPYPAY